MNFYNKIVNLLKTKSKSATGGEIIKVLFIRIVGICATYLSMYFVINWGSVRDWGWIMLIISILNIIGIIGIFGLHTLILKRFPINTIIDNKRELHAIFSIVAGFSLITVLLLLPFKGFFLNEVFDVNKQLPFWIYLLFLLLIPVFNFQKIILSLFRVNRQIILFGLFNANNIYFIFLSIVAGILILLDNKISTFAILSLLWIIPISALLIGGYLALKKAGGLYISNLFSNHPQLSKSLLKESLPLVLSSSLMLLMSWTDTFLIGLYMTPEDVGYYNIIFKISSIATIFLSVVNAVVTPKLSLLYKQDKEKLGRFVRKSNKYIFVFTSFTLLVIMLFSETMLGLFGDDLSFLKLPLLVLIIGYFINAYCGTIGYLLQMTGYAKIFQNVVLIAAIANVGLNMVLIPVYGLLGAAIASTISMSFWNIAGTYIVNKKLKINTLFFR